MTTNNPTTTRHTSTNNPSARLDLARAYFPDANPYCAECRLHCRIKVGISSFER